jgi:dsRNA-specific ribonuclease
MDIREERDLAWVGDAVLALWAREWLLREPRHPLFSRQERFIRLTSNDFLKSLGEPTRVEAEIGVVYRKEGLEAAFEHMEKHLKPLFIKHLNNASKGRKGQKR